MARVQPSAAASLAAFRQLRQLFPERLVIGLQSHGQDEGADANLGAVDQPPGVGQPLQADAGGKLRDVHVHPRKTIGQGQLDDFTLVPGNAEHRRIQVLEHAESSVDRGRLALADGFARRGNPLFFQMAAIDGRGGFGRREMRRSTNGPTVPAACRFSVGCVQCTTASCGWCVARTPHVAPAWAAFRLNRQAA